MRLTIKHIEFGRILTIVFVIIAGIKGELGLFTSLASLAFLSQFKIIFR